MRKRKNEIQTKNGYALLLALLLTTTIASSAIALSRVVILNLRQTQYINQAIVASAAAASGMEKALFLLRKTGKEVQPEETFSFEEEIDSGQKATVQVSLGEEAIFKIPKNDSAVLPLPANSGVSQLSIKKPNNEDVKCSEGTGAWLEISHLTWNGDKFDIWRQPFSLNNLPKTIDIPSDKAVEIRLKALYCDLVKLTVENGSGGTLPSRVIINSIGEYGGSKQALRASILAQPPLSGLFDYVLFSETEITK